MGATQAQPVGTIYPNLASQPKEVQDAVRIAYDHIYQLRAQLAQVVTAHNQLLERVKGLTTTGDKQQLQITLLNNIP